jgi:glyoxylase-like metal-dependent hydrolase (beta-lactamase superfamily II)
MKLAFQSVFLAVIITFQFSLVTMGQTNPDLAVGDFKVHVLQDAQIYLQNSYLTGIEANEAKKLTGGRDSVLTPVNAFLVLTSNHTILVDAGIGKYPGEDSGHLMEQLNNAGIDPNKVDLILITHFHFDHIGGLTSPEGKKLFVNAIVRASKAESDFWMRDSSLIPEKLRERSAKIKTILSPYVSTKSYLPFLPDENLGDGIKAISANGHTPGHTVYSFSSKGKELWCIGDLIHFGLIQFEHPTVGITFDSNGQMAIASRIDFFQRAAKAHIVLAGAHLPSMVKLEKKGDAFVATPVNAY